MILLARIENCDMRRKSGKRQVQTKEYSLDLFYSVDLAAQLICKSTNPRRLVHENTDVTFKLSSTRELEYTLVFLFLL